MKSARHYLTFPNQAGAGTLRNGVKIGHREGIRDLAGR
jgi:hypothetical protein